MTRMKKDRERRKEDVGTQKNYRETWGKESPIDTIRYLERKPLALQSF